MRIINYSALLFSFFLTLAGSAQEYPKDYFRSPLDIPLYLSGSFGELRSNHFHTGLDIKTNGVEGQRVYACADGFISRVQVSHWGYGLVLYMDHPNGFTTVYAHLSRFHPRIEEFVRTHQYAQQKETLNLTFLPDSVLQFKKGDVIGWSGNSGSSGGPHLHFEVRETKTEKALNPWLFGFNIKDDLPPLLHHIKVFPLDETSSVKGKSLPATFNLTGTGKNYILTGSEQVLARGKIGFAIHTIDKTTGSGNLCGIYKIHLYKNDTLIFQQEMSCIDFSTNRYINAHMDYLEYKKNKNSYHKSFINGNNQLEIYPVKIEDGIVTVSGTQPVKMRYVVEDISGNMSVLNFTVMPDAAVRAINQPVLCSSDQFAELKWFGAFTRETEDFSLNIPEKGIYDNYCMPYIAEAKRSGMVARVHSFGDTEIPVQDYMEVKIRVDSIPAQLYEKLLAVYINPQGRISSEGGTFEDGWVKFRTRSFGKYSVMIDTVSPVIKPLNIYDGKILGGQKSIDFSITDNLSGIDSYNAYVDEKWILMNYNTRTGRVSLNLEKEKVSSGAHQLVIKIGDARGNISTFSAKFTR